MQASVHVFAPSILPISHVTVSACHFAHLKAALRLTGLDEGLQRGTDDTAEVLVLGTHDGLML